MLMPRRSRLQLEQQSTQSPASTSPPGNQQDDSASSSQALISRLASFASAKHVPLNSVLAHLHLPPPPSATLDERHTRHLVAVLAARIRCAPPSAVVAATFGELAGTPTSAIFPKKGEKDVLPRSALASAFATFLPVSADFSIPQAVDFLMYNNRNRVRVCDVEHALHPPQEGEDGEGEDGQDTITVVEDEAENERKMQEFAEMARKIEEAEALADSAVDAGEIATVISFLDPGDDGEVDLKELEGAFRISRRDQAQEKVDLGKQQAVVDKLKAHLVELSKPIEEKSDFTDEEIDRLMNFMDPDRDGITTDEFEAGFRQARRAKASAEAELAGRATLRKLLDRIGEVHPEFEKPLDWFNLCNTNPGPPGSPVEVSGLELREGLKDLKTFAGKDIDALLKYMDPDGDCDLSVPEFESALARLAAEPASNTAAAAAGEIVVKLEVPMAEANIRMMDLFRMMDKDGEGSIEPGEMRAGLLKLAMPSGVRNSSEARERGG
jgi:Ca2+-binding EF-hand superfamily protein